MSDVGLWGKGPDGVEVEIPVLGVTGEYQSGKTLFCCSIAPGKRGDGTARTLVYDLELSSKGYLGLGFDRIDVPEAVTAKTAAGAAYKPIDMFRWWRTDILNIPAGKYDVIVVDPINDLEGGLVDFVKLDHARYGFASADSFSKTGGIFWNAVRSEWKALLASIATRCKTFAFTVHLRQVWSGGSPTKDKKPAGKTTLAELSSLYVWLERNGKMTAPRAHHMEKNRLCYAGVGEDGNVGIIPILPPAFDDCTPQHIREFIAKPANYAKLAKSELVKPDELSDADRLQMELQKAQAEQAASESRLALAIRQQELRDAMAESRAAAQAASPSQDVSAQRIAQQTVDAAKTPPAATEAEPTTATEVEKSVEPVPFDEPKADADAGDQDLAKLVTSLLSLKSDLGMPDDRFNAGVAKNTTNGSSNPMDLTTAAARRLIDQLEGVKRQRVASGN